VEDELGVLLIEDDAAVAEMYRIKLAADGYRVSIASDGERGIEMAREDPPDLIYLDIRLPSMDGFQVLEQLRADDRTRSVPVIILSNYGQAELVEKGLKLGALEFLVKADTSPALLSDKVQRYTQERPTVGA
jgi:DNA-binding response OmpR family regulator